MSVVEEGGENFINGICKRTFVSQAAKERQFSPQVIRDENGVITHILGTSGHYHAVDKDGHLLPGTEEYRPCIFQEQ